MASSAPKFCTCPDYAMCYCGDEVPHCTYCCLDLTPEQIEAEKKREEKWNREQEGK